jgi:hypothetical protein
MRGARALMAVYGSERPTGTQGRPVRVSAATPGAARAYSGCITNLEQERRTTMLNPIARHRRRTARLAARLSAVLVVALAATLLASGTFGAQSTRSTAAAPAVQAAANATTLGGGPDLQGLWDFTMRVDERSSPGFFALGPVDGGWAGSITLYLTNTLAIRALTVDGDSVRMVVASREGDVVFRARLTDDARAMEGIVEYHGGARLPMMATRRARPVVPR